jgi:protein involved in polysaccharide export with SLBB domain
VFHLNPYDLVSIRSDPYFNNQKQVTISGEVLYPGQYTILNSDEKITDIITRAGGLRSSAYLDASQYTRKGVRINASFSDIIKNPKSKLNFKVQNGDGIMILPHSNVVRITGEVNTVGIHKYVSGKRLRYYLNLAGGLNPDADKSNIWVEYPSGDSKKYSRVSLLSPKISDGSSITVGKQKEEEPFDRTEFAKEFTAILANLAQTVVVVALAVR